MISGVLAASCRRFSGQRLIGFFDPTYEIPVHVRFTIGYVQDSYIPGAHSLHESIMSRYLLAKKMKQ